MKINQQKTNRLALSVAFFTLFTVAINAQNFSNWAVDKAHPTLKARYATVKDAKGYNFTMLEVSSSVGCKFQVTTTLCSTDSKDKNGWRSIVLLPNQPKRVNFKIMNSCTNGWWWWYQNYASTAVKFDDN